MRRLLLPVLLLVGAVALGVLVRTSPSLPIDAAVGDALARPLGGPLEAALEATSRALSPPWHLVATALLALLVLLVRDLRRAALLVVCVLATLALVHVGKRTVARPRPLAASIPEASAAPRTSYPSGHVAWTTAALGSLALALLDRGRRRLRRLALLLVVLAVAWVGASRIHLERHHLTDVLGGAWLGFGVVALLGAGERRPAKR